MHQNSKPPTLQQASLGKSFPDSLEFIVAKLLKKDPKDRYRSMEDLCEDLQNVRAGRELVFVRPHVRVTDPNPNQLLETKTQAVLYNEDEELVDYSKRHRDPFLDKIAATAIGLLVFLGVSFVLIMFVPPIISQWQITRAEQEARRSSENLQPVATEKQPVNEQDLKELENTKEPFVNPSGGRTAKATVFSFPPHINLGMLTQTNNSGEEEELPDAQGNVEVKTGAQLHFYPSYNCGLHPKLFRKFAPNDLFAISMNRRSTDTDDQLHFLNHLKGLKRLSLDETDVSSAGISAINDLHLTQLDIRHTTIDGKAIAAFSKLGHLEGLAIGPLASIKDVLKALQRAKSLKTLYIQDCNLDASSIQDIASIRPLERLVLSHDSFNRRDLVPLARMKNLQHFITDQEKSPEEISRLFSNEKSPVEVSNKGGSVFAEGNNESGAWSSSQELFN